MPDPRYRILGVPIPDSPSFTMWITPSFEGAIIGLTVYIVILLISAYIFFRIRRK